MAMVSRDKLKRRGIRRFGNSFKYAMDGLRYAFKYEQNMTVHIMSTLAVIFLGIFLHISTMEWLISFLIVGLVIATELINTSVEALVDLASPEINPLAKVAKDTAAAAVMVFGIVAIFIAMIIFLPKLILLFI